MCIESGIVRSTFYSCVFFFFNDTATTEIYTLSLHDALPIYRLLERVRGLSRPSLLSLRNTFRRKARLMLTLFTLTLGGAIDRKSTRLNSSHANISYAVFCLKKKNKKNNINSVTMYYTKFNIC